MMTRTVTKCTVTSNLVGVGWNESGWHYSEDAAAGGTLTCQYVFVLGEIPSYFTPREGGKGSIVVGNEISKYGGSVGDTKVGS